MADALHDLAVIVLDCQATGASPRYGHVLELGWLATRAVVEPDASGIIASCVALPEGAEIPNVVRELTGIGPDDVVGVPDAAELWARLCADAVASAGEDGVAIAVVHFARFEHSFLQDLHAREQPGVRFPLRMLCTHEIARRLLPGMPRLGLRALAGYFGHGAAEPRRSQGHVWATAFVWRHLVEQLAARGITDLAGLDALLAGAVPRPARKREYPMPKAKRLALPDAPGVYRMLRTSGDVLYVGKATSLKKRVNSYFQKQSNVPDRLLEMLSQARDLEVTPTASALEAAMLETDEIKRLAPPFNSALLTGERAAWFVGGDLGAPTPLTTRSNRLGPMGSQWHARRFAALVRALGREEIAEGERHPIIAALGWPDAREIDASALAEGFVKLREELGAVVLDRRAAMRIGAQWWRERLAAGVPIVEVEENESVEEVPWTAEEVHEELREVIITFARVMRRARWLRALSESVVGFVDGGVARVLVIERGVVVECRDQAAGVGLVMPCARGERARCGSFDLATFDRLRVLTTELRRIAMGGGVVAVWLGRGRLLVGDRLARVLAWV